MTPKEKAEHLISLFDKETDGIAAYNYSMVNIDCAMICVEEIIRSEPLQPCGDTGIYSHQIVNAGRFWKEVLTELQAIKEKQL